MYELYKFALCGSIQTSNGNIRLPPEICEKIILLNRPRLPIEIYKNARKLITYIDENGMKRRLI